SAQDSSSSPRPPTSELGGSPIPSGSASAPSALSSSRSSSSKTKSRRMRGPCSDPPGSCSPPSSTETRSSRRMDSMRGLCDSSCSSSPPFSSPTPQSNIPRRVRPCRRASSYCSRCPQSRVPSGAPLIPVAPRLLSSACMAHGENQRSRRPCPRPLSEARRESNPRPGPASRGGDRPRLGHAADSLHGPAGRRFPPRVFRRERASRVPPTRHLAPSERNPDISAALSLFQQWFDGQRRGDTPAPIPNPEVKPAHVPCGSSVREPARSLPSFEEGLGRRPRYASRPSLWWTTNRAVLTAADPWNAVSHSLFPFATLGPPLESDDHQGNEGHVDHVREFRDCNDRGRLAAVQREPSRRRVVQEGPVHELRAAERRIDEGGHREAVAPRCHVGEVPEERPTVVPCWRRCRALERHPAGQAVLDRDGAGGHSSRVVVVKRESRGVH